VLSVSVGVSGNLVFMVAFTRVHVLNPMYVVEVLVIQFEVRYFRDEIA